MDKKIILLGCSMKFRDLARSTVKELNKLGYKAIFPNLDRSLENRDTTSSLSEKNKLAWEHYKAIESADAVYFIVPNGYMGSSCKIELGYTLANKKPIFFSEPTNELDLDCYPKKIIPLGNLTLFREEIV